MANERRDQTSGPSGQQQATPTITWLSPARIPLVSGEFTIKVVGYWSVPVTGFTEDDLTFDNIATTVANFEITDGQLFSFDLTHPAVDPPDHVLTVDIHPNLVTPANNFIGRFIVATTDNTVAWTVPSTKQIRAFTVRGQWSTALTNSASFTNSDVTVTAGTISDFVLESNNQDFSFTVTPPTGTGIITVNIARRTGTVDPYAAQSVGIFYGPARADSRIAFTYPAGSQTLHANFTTDDNGFYFATNGTVAAFNTDGTRDASRDITLQNAPTTGPNATIWGFTKRGDNWVILTRESGSGTIGKVREYAADGSELQNFDIANSVTTVQGETFRAPKGLAVDGSNYYIRVVRSVSGNMRLVKYGIAGNASNEDIVLASSNPTSLSDMVAINGILFIIQQNQRIAYATRLSDNTHAVLSDLEVTLDTRGTTPFAATARSGSLYIADRGGYIYAYDEVAGEPEVTGGGGFNFGILNAIQLSAAMRRNMNRRNEERR